jgi:hypothetical protein
MKQEKFMSLTYFSNIPMGRKVNVEVEPLI